MAIDPDILATLTDEERQAIEEGMTDSEKEALKALADSEDDDDDEGDEDEGSANAAPVEGKGAADADGGDTAKPASDAKPAAAASEHSAGDQGDDDVAPEKFKPQYQVQLPENYDDLVKSVQDESRTLAQQFKDGDIDFDEFEAKRSELDARRDTLREIRVKAEISAEMSEQNAQQEWAFTVKSFVKQVAKGEGIDYAKDEAKRDDLDMFVKRLGSDPKNADKDMEWFLSEAHKRVKALHGIGKQEAPAGDKPSKDKPTRKTPIDAMPKNLSQVPGGDGPGDVGDEFADLDSLEGEALEAAIKKMTPAQREKFAMGA